MTSGLACVLIGTHLLCKPIKLLHFERIFQNTNGFNPESAVRRITSNIVTFCQRTLRAVRI